MNSLLPKNIVPAKPAMLQGKGQHFVQAQPTVNEPGDIYEQEADAMADRVMRMSLNEIAKPVTGLIGNSLQRKCAHCDEEDKKKKPIMRKTEVGNAGKAVSSSFSSLLNASKGGGSPLPQGTRNFMENAFSTDFSAVKIHTGSDATEMSKGINARAFTHGNDIYFREGQYNPFSSNGKHLLAHELTHTIQQHNGSITRQKIQRDIWFRGEGTGVAPAAPGSVIHDFGDGLYMTDSPELAAQYAALRSASAEGSTPLILSAEIESSTLGRVLNLLTDTRWQQFLAESPIPGGPTHQALIQMANENYWPLFETFLRRNALTIENFDSIIGQEFVRGGTQICIRNPSFISRIRTLLRPYVPPTGAGAGTPSAGATEPTASTPIRVTTRYNILNTAVNEAGNTVAEVEIILGQGTEELSRLSQGTSLPSRIVLRITTNAEGALVGAESVGIELSSGVTEALARQIIATIPEAAVSTEGAVAGTAARAAGSSRWVRGLGWAGIILFVGVTAYQYSQANTDRARGRVLVTAGSGFAGGMLGTYLVCNLVFGIESFGLSLIGCGLLAGGASTYIASEVSGEMYDEATATPLERSIHALQMQPEMVRRLFFGMIDSNGTVNGLPLTDEFVREFMRVVPSGISQYEVAVLLGNLRQSVRGDSVASAIRALQNAITQLPGRRPIPLPAVLDITDFRSRNLIFPNQIDTDISIPLGPVRLLPPLRQMPGSLGTDASTRDRQVAPFIPLAEIAL